jgi:hypothetical protein
MATIIINAITHRAACLDALGEADAKAYYEAISAYFAKLGEQAKADGFGFEVDDQGQGAASYRVTDERDENDYNAAHEFMQSAQSFWEAY